MSLAKGNAGLGPEASVKWVTDAMAQRGMALPCPIVMGSGDNCFTHVESGVATAIEVGDRVLDNPLNAQARDVLAKRLAGMGLDAEQAKAQSAKLLEVFYILHEIGHANAFSMANLNGTGTARPNLSREYLSVYRESYADAFAAVYMPRIGVDPKYAAIVSETVAGEVRMKEEEIFKRHLAMGDRRVGLEDFDHSTGNVALQASRIDPLGRMPAWQAQARMKEIALARAQAFASDRALAPLSGQQKMELNAAITGTADVCRALPEVAEKLRAQRGGKQSGAGGKVMDCGGSSPG